MGLFEQFETEARSQKLDFLVIGGLAITFHGVSRDTADLDLLARREQRNAWLNLFSGLGYTIFQDRSNFLQLHPPKGGAWPVDLMLVGTPTFESMFASASNVRMFDAEVKIPCLEHLLALKLHALKYGHVGRYSKDLLDVEHLVRANQLDLKSQRIRELFLRHGTIKIYEQISRFTREGPI